MNKKAKKFDVACYFEKLNEVYVCQSENDGVICSEKLGLKVFNLRRHIQRHHPDIFKCNVEEEETKKQEDVQTCSSGKRKQQMLSKYFWNEKVTVSMTKDKFK